MNVAVASHDGCSAFIHVDYHRFAHHLLRYPQMPVLTILSYAFFCFEDNITLCSEDAEICLCCKIVLPHLECVHKCFFAGYV